MPEYANCIKYWNVDARATATIPVLTYWDSLSPEERAQFSALTIVPARLWRPVTEPLSFSVPGAHRALTRQFSKPGLDHIPLIWALDIVFAPPFGQSEGAFGTQLHFHTLTGVHPKDKGTQALLRERLADWAPGPRSLHFQPISEEAGGAEGWLNYSIKDWCNPLKVAPVPRRTQLCRNRWTGLMRAYVTSTNLRPADLIGMKNFRRVHGRLLPASNDRASTGS